MMPPLWSPRFWLLVCCLLFGSTLATLAVSLHNALVQGVLLGGVSAQSGTTHTESKQIAFPAATDGPWQWFYLPATATATRMDCLVTAEIDGGTHTGSNNAADLTDSGATFQTTGVDANDRVFNISDGSICTITSVTSQTALDINTCTGGTDNDFDTNDIYEIHGGDADGMAAVTLQIYVATAAGRRPLLGDGEGIANALTCDLTPQSNTSPARPTLTGGRWIGYDIGTTNDIPEMLSFSLTYTVD